MKSLKSDIEILAKDIPLGCTATHTCPLCVQEWEQQRRPLNWRPNKSMSLTRIETGVLYKCFRASCSGSGFIPLEFLFLKEQKHLKKQEYNNHLVFPPAEVLEYLYLNFEFTERDITVNNIKYCPEGQAVVYSITDEYKREVGVVDRDYFTDRKPKTLNYFFNDVPKVHVQRAPVLGDSLIIVEDIVSAIKASYFLPSAALLGTYMSATVARHLRGLTTKIILALDQDATQRAVQIRDKYLYFFDSIVVLPLSKDIKNTSYKELEKIL